MPNPVLTWTKRTESSFVVAGANITAAEFINKIESFVNGCTHFKAQGKTLDGPNNRGYIELAPRSLVAGVTEARLLIAYSGKTTPDDVNAANVQLPAISANTARCFVGVSPNANTTGPNANPYTGLAYTSAGWSKMFGTSGAQPPNGSAIGAIESAECLMLYWYTAANVMDYILFGKMAESIDGNSAEWVLGCSHTGLWNTSPGAINSPHPIPAKDYNNSGSAAGNKLVAVRNDSSLAALNRTQWDTNFQCGDGFAGIDYAALQQVVVSGGGYFSGPQGSLYGVLRQMRFGPEAFNLQRLVDGAAATQAIAWNYHSSVKQPSTLWFDSQR